MICVTRATAMLPRFSLEQERDPHVDPVLDDRAAVDRHALPDHLEAREGVRTSKGLLDGIARYRTLAGSLPSAHPLVLPDATAR